MRVGIGAIRHIKVDDVRNIGHVDSARRNIGCNHNVIFPGAKTVDCRLPVILCHIALQRGDSIAAFCQVRRHFACAALGSCKHKNSPGWSHFQNRYQQL